MKEYIKPKVTHVPLVTSPMLGAGGTNVNACRGAGEPYTGSEGNAAGQCQVLCFIASPISPVS
jgi:hypothetical protein